MKNMEYINFPVSYLQEKDLTKTFIRGFCFGVYEYKLKNEKNHSFFDGMITKYGIDKIAKDLNFYEFAEKEYNENARSRRCGVKIKTFLNYITYQKDKDDLAMRAFCATKAIIGNNTYKKSNYEEIFALMFGYTSIKDVPEEIQTKHIRFLNPKMNDRRVLRDTLINSWSLGYHSHHTRGFYISYKLKCSDLTFEIEKNKYLKGNKLKPKSNKLKSETKKGLEKFEAFKKKIEEKKKKNDEENDEEILTP